MGSWGRLRYMQSAWRAAINLELYFLCADSSNQRFNDLFNQNGVSLKSKNKFSLTSSATSPWNGRQFRKEAKHFLDHWDLGHVYNKEVERNVA